MKKQIYVDFEKCLGCKSCELACAVAHSQSKDLWSAIAERPLPQSRVQVEAIEGFAIPLHCRHCEDAPCVQVCPTHAMSRPDPEGPVICQSSRCIGCTLCVLVCPFGVLRMNRAGKAIIKCDLCIDLLREGQGPACVTACPTHAIRLISVEGFSKEVAQRAREEWIGAQKAGKEIKIPVQKG